MDYKEKVIALLSSQELSKEQKEKLEEIFPELAKSEDERIRKWLIGHFNQYIIDGMPQVFGNGLNVKDVITWLEKQGEQKSADKVEPKFHKGDWIANESRDICLITDIDLENGYYICESNRFGNTGGGAIESIDKHYHLWTIEDAKDGDVLVCVGKYGQEIGVVKEYVGKYGGCDKCFETYCFVDWDGIFRIGEYMGSKEIYPATKEQRDLLFQKMKEEGYEWDAEKKELKKSLSETSLSDFESALFTAFSDAWQSYLRGEEVNVTLWTKEHSSELLETAKEELTDAFIEKACEYLEPILTEYAGYYVGSDILEYFKIHMK